MSARLILGGPKQDSIRALLKILDEAWESNTYGFDIEEAVQQTGVEIALF